MNHTVLTPIDGRTVDAYIHQCDIICPGCAAAAVLAEQSAYGHAARLVHASTGANGAELVEMTRHLLDIAEARRDGARVARGYTGGGWGYSRRHVYGPCAIEGADHVDSDNFPSPVDFSGRSYTYTAEPDSINGEHCGACHDMIVDAWCEDCGRDMGDCTCDDDDN